MRFVRLDSRDNVVTVTAALGAGAEVEAVLTRGAIPPIYLAAGECCREDNGFAAPARHYRDGPVALRAGRIDRSVRIAMLRRGRGALRSENIYEPDLPGGGS